MPNKNLPPTAITGKPEEAEEASTVDIVKKQPEQKQNYENYSTLTKEDSKYYRNKDVKFEKIIIDLK